MSNGIMIIEPETEMHARLTGSLQATRKRSHATTTLYNAVAEAYNKCEVEGYIVVTDLNDKRVSNLEKVFLNRGLSRNVDFEIYRPTCDESGAPIPKSKRKTLLKKISATLMRVV
jgi:hypothetical protein